MKSDDFVEVAKLGKTVGLNGFVKLYNLSDFPKQFKKGAKFFVDKDKILEISDFDEMKNIVRFIGISDKDTASGLTNKILKTTREITIKECKLKEDEFFWFDIIGCKIVEDGVVLGAVKDIERIGCQDYLVVTSDIDIVKNGFQEQFLVPYIKRYVIHTDISLREIKTLDVKDFLEKVD